MLTCSHLKTLCFGWLAVLGISRKSFYSVTYHVVRLKKIVGIFGKTLVGFGNSLFFL